MVYRLCWYVCWCNIVWRSNKVSGCVIDFYDKTVLVSSQRDHCSQPEDSWRMVYRLCWYVCWCNIVGRSNKVSGCVIEFYNKTVLASSQRDPCSWPEDSWRMAYRLCWYVCWCNIIWRSYKVSMCVYVIDFYNKTVLVSSQRDPCSQAEDSWRMAYRLCWYVCWCNIIWRSYKVSMCVYVIDFYNKTVLVSSESDPCSPPEDSRRMVYRLCWYVCWCNIVGKSNKISVYRLL